MKISILNPLDKFKSLANMQIASVVMIVGILVTGWLLSMSLKKYTESKSALEEAISSQGKKQDDVKIDKIPLDPQKIEEIAKVVGLMHPQLIIEVEGADLKLSSKNSTDYERWFLAMLAAQNYGGQSTQWNVSEICMGKCIKDYALHANLQPFTRKVITQAK